MSQLDLALIDAKTAAEVCPSDPAERRGAAAWCVPIWPRDRSWTC